jgi:hypothetical protein
MGVKKAGWNPKKNTYLLPPLPAILLSIIAGIVTSDIWLAIFLALVYSLLTYAIYIILFLPSIAMIREFSAISIWKAIVAGIFSTSCTAACIAEFIPNTMYSGETWGARLLIIASIMLPLGIYLGGGFWLLEYHKGSSEH